MTKAPERISVFHSRGARGDWVGTCTDRPVKGGEKYVHDDHNLALVAVEQKEIHEMALDFCQFNALLDALETRTPDDATAALERVKQEVAEQAAKLADEWYHNSGHGSPGDEIRAALITEGQSDG